MHTSRSAVDIAVVDGALYAVGGNDGCSSLNTVEKLVLLFSTSFLHFCFLESSHAIVKVQDRAFVMSCACDYYVTVMWCAVNIKVYLRHQT